MTLDLLNGKIKLYNYERSPVAFPSNHSVQGVYIRGRDEDEDYVVERVAWDDIESENTKSNLFKVGRLRFDSREEDEAYKSLGIEDRSNILTDKELMAKLQEDNIETIKWISGLKSSTLLSRMKNMLFKMERTDIDIKAPHNILAVVTERNNEIKFGGKRHENSEINRLLNADKLKNDKSDLQKQLAEMNDKLSKLEQESKAKDDLLAQSQTGMQDLLKIIEGLKSESTNDTPEVKKTTTRKNTTNKTTATKTE
jgi:hypothetical protein